MIQKANNLNEVLKILLQGKNILILPHILPDGDTIGSSLAFCLALKKIGKNAFVLLDEELPYNLRFLPCQYIHSELASLNFVPDLIVTIDASDTDRLGERSIYLHKNISSLNIDHHITNTYFADLNYVNETAAATGEIIFDIIKSLNIPMDSEIATCLYTAISTDTGSFKYSNTTPQTHLISAELMSLGIKLNDITTEIYHNKPCNQITLLADVLSTLEFYYSGKLAIIHVTQDILNKNQINISDTDGLIEFARDISGVEVAILLKELAEKHIKVGFRSKYEIDVSKVAATFGGGGHKKASGCTLHDNLHNSREILIKTFKTILR